MQEARLTVASREKQTDRAIMDLFLIDAPGALWSEDEVADAIGDRVDALDGLARLERAGLVHRLKDFAFATRSASRAFEIQE